MTPDMERATREAIRWYILVALDAGRPSAVAEALILPTLQSVPLPVTGMCLRRELDYLADRGLVTVSGKEGPIWVAELTRHGVDVVEYTVECEPGVGRPKKYW